MQQAKKDVPWAPDCHRDEAALTRLLMNLMACGLRSGSEFLDLARREPPAFTARATVSARLFQHRIPRTGLPMCPASMPCNPVTYTGTKVLTGSVNAI